jgi:transposase
LLKAIFDRAKAMHLLDKAAQGAIDATGLETRYTSQHYIRCRRRKSFSRRHWPKLTVVCDTKTHLIGGCIVTRGPSYDFPNLIKLMEQADKQIHFDQLLADAGYDSEQNHRFCREVLRIRSTVIACNQRRTSKLPSGKYRRQMVQRFARKAYRNRWQVESVFSRNKRLLGSALRARKRTSRERECFVRILTHNLMIIRRAA